MKNKTLLFIVFIFALPALAVEDSMEGPVQHYVIADVTSMEEAKEIFISNTSEIKSKKKLNSMELEEIHIITYSLEKSIAYFVKNLCGERQSLAKEIAISVEDIHINAENNRSEKTNEHLNKYYTLAEQLISVL